MDNFFFSSFNLIVNWSYFITTRQWKKARPIPSEIAGLVFGSFTFLKKKKIKHNTVHFQMSSERELLLRKILQKSRDGIFFSLSMKTTFPI